MIKIMKDRRGEKEVSLSYELKPSPWKWDVIYFNPEDSRIFVEKQSGYGYTLNMAQWLAYVILGVMILPVLAILILGK
jgi:uncharacterized membrane protein